MKKEFLEKVYDLKVREDKYLDVFYETHEGRNYIVHNERYYKAYADFRTVDQPYKKLHKNYIEAYQNYEREIKEAIIKFKNKKKIREEEKAKAQEVRVQEVEVRPAPIVDRSKTGGLGGALEQLLFELLTTETMGVMKEEMIPFVKSYIEETYGVLPKRIEVKKDEEVREVKGTPHEKFETVLKLVNADIPVFLTGPAGSGKNHLCKMVADALGLDFYFTNAVTSEYKLTGFIDANGTYHETEFYKAFKNGGLFMLDEIDASIPEVLIILNAGIANRYFDFPNGKIEAHKDFRVIGAGNTVGTGADSQYVGRLQLDASSLDRFALVEVNYSKSVELAIANGNQELVDFIRNFRRGLKNCGFEHLVSYRAIERITKLEGVLELDEIIDMCLLKHMSFDDRKILLNSMDKEENKYYKVMNKLVA